jgi:hypothetical protein
MAHVVSSLLVRTAVAGAVALVLAGAALAQPGERGPRNPFDPRGNFDTSNPFDREERAAPLPPFQVVEQLRRSEGGELVGVLGLEGDGGQRAYRVRWRQDDGQVVDLIVDAQSGRVVRRTR